MKKFNINDHMYIQINKNGWEYLKETVGDNYIKHSIESRKVVIENNLCWVMFEIFYYFQPFGIEA